MINLDARGYITEGVILALMSCFSVAKGIENIKIVLDATVRRLNKSLCIQKFMLPSMVSFCITVGPKAHMVYIDVGEMFYNFRLSLVLEKYCGVGLVSYLGSKNVHQVTPLSIFSGYAQLWVWFTQTTPPQYLVC